MGCVTAIWFIFYNANYVSLFTMELKKLPVNDKIRASYEANKYYVSQALYEKLQTTHSHKNDNYSKMSWLPSPPRITDLQLKLHQQKPPMDTSHETSLSHYIFQ